MFAHEAPLDLIRVRVVKRKYQFEKENVKSGNGFEFPQFVHLEVSPKLSLADLKILIKKKLHVGQSAPVQLKGEDFNLQSKDELSLYENGISD